MQLHIFCRMDMVLGDQTFPCNRVLQLSKLLLGPYQDTCRFLERIADLELQCTEFFHPSFFCYRCLELSRILLMFHLGDVSLVLFFCNICLYIVYIINICCKRWKSSRRMTNCFRRAINFFVDHLFL